MAGTNVTQTDIDNLKTEETSELTKLDTIYDSAISGVEDNINKQQTAVKNWEKTQTDLQNKQTDFTIQQINQQKGQAKSDYIKEQSGAYKDWQKQSNAYGANAEAMAAQGMANSGYSESSQVSMYNTYQNRVATAREAYSRAVLNYDNAITQAQLQNSSALAEIAYESLSKQLELSLTGMQYKNTLILEKASAARAISSDYWSRYMNLLSQINTQKNYELDLAKFNYAKEQDAKDDTGGVRVNNPAIVKNFDKIKGVANVIRKASNSAKTTKSPTVDMNSVMSLGYGPISPTKLNQLVMEGKAKESEKNGKLVYTKTFNF